MKNILLAGFILLNILTTAFASDITQERGYVNFENLEGIYGEPKVMINLNQTMLGFVSKMNSSDPEAAELISKLKAVRVQIYSIDDNEQPALDLIARITQDIKSKDWMPIVSINEKKEKVRVFTKLTNDIMDGLVVMVIKEEDNNNQAIFINIVGEIDPAQISKVTDSLNIDVDLADE